MRLDTPALAGWGHGAFRVTDRARLICSNDDVRDHCNWFHCYRWLLPVKGQTTLASRPRVAGTGPRGFVYIPAVLVQKRALSLPQLPENSHSLPTALGCAVAHIRCPLSAELCFECPGLSYLSPEFSSLLLLDPFLHPHTPWSREEGPPATSKSLCGTESEGAIASRPYIKRYENTQP